MEFNTPDVVIVESPNNFQGIRLAIVLPKQKWCKDGVPVMLVDEKEPIRNLCIVDYLGDTIRQAPKKDEIGDNNS